MSEGNLGWMQVANRTRVCQWIGQQKRLCDYCNQMIVTDIIVMRLQMGY